MVPLLRLLPIGLPRILAEQNLAVGAGQTAGASFNSPALLGPVNGGYCRLYQARLLWLIINRMFVRGQTVLGVKADLLDC
jgi:hypothetical protein